jgi:hypothetical protein
MRWSLDSQAPFLCKDIWWGDNDSNNNDFSTSYFFKFFIPLVIEYLWFFTGF